MIDLIKKTLLAGAGAVLVTKDKVEHSLEDFVRQGKVTAADARIMAERIAEQGRKEFDEVCAQLNSKFREFASKDDKAAHDRIAALEKRVQDLEQKLTPPSTRAGEP